MRITRITSVAMVMVAVVARFGGAQAAAAAKPATTTSQDSLTDAAFKKLGVLAYPAKGQSAAKQTQDQRECYAWAKDQTGFDPATAAAPNADSAAKAAKEQTATATQGAAVKGAAKGAAAEASTATTAAANGQVDTFKKAVGTCLEGRGYTFSK